MVETDDLPRIEEIGGYVSQSRALQMLNSRSKSWLHNLVRAGKIRAARLDERTLLYNKRSLEYYLETKQIRHPRKEQEPSLASGGGPAKELF